ncbi:class II aldolase/adducin family protein [Candidimonas nitroreducens]|uniref:Class II aldolase n=1 Tax=Candidimonas nitroreducens TaxID=683354 RepID=A0A225MT15_9BURK|nr:class II aldolase/adducin family protein [Candidimonas nitroreducens]OWT61799.1 class II aldolase [Candidimonas nitroreducens]
MINSSFSASTGSATSSVQAPTSPNLAIESARERVSPGEWETRVNLAACYRLMSHFGMTEMIANHISARVPGTHDRFLINPYGLLYDEVTASSLLEIDLEGNVHYNPTDLDFNKAGFVIHSAIHRALPEVECVIHSHTIAGMAVSALECGLVPISQTAMRFAKIAYHSYEGVVLNMDEQARLVEDLGEHEAMILRNHGLLTVGNTILEAFNTMFRLERACQMQIAAMSCGQKLSLPPDDVVQKTYEIFHPKLQPSFRRKPGRLEWPALLRMLDRVDPSFRE